MDAYFGCGKIGHKIEDCPTAQNKESIGHSQGHSAHKGQGVEGIQQGGAHVTIGSTVFKETWGG